MITNIPCPYCHNYLIRAEYYSNDTLYCDGFHAKTSFHFSNQQQSQPQQLLMVVMDIKENVHLLIEMNIIKNKPKIELLEFRNHSFIPINLKINQAILNLSPNQIKNKLSKLLTFL